jgi:hypothetical protein
MSVYLDKEIYSIQWFVAPLQLSWGWNIQAEDILYVTMLFALGSFGRSKNINVWLLPLVGSLVVISAFSYQSLILYVLISYLPVFKPRLQSRYFIFPSVLLVFLSFERIWNQTEVLSLNDHLSGKLTGLIVLLVAIFYLYHVINLLRKDDSLNPTNLILLSVTQYIVSRTLPPYFESDLFILILSATSFIWFIVTVLGLLSKARNGLSNFNLRLVFIQLSIFSLVPTSLGLGHYVVLGMGLLWTINQQSALRTNERTASKLYVAAINYICALSPITWLFIWPLYELQQVSGYNLIVSFLLYASISVYALVHLSQMKVQINLKDLKPYRTEDTFEVVKIVFVILLLTAPLKLIFPGNYRDILVESIVNPFALIYITLWFGYVFYKHFLKKGADVRILQQYAANSMPGKPFEITSVFCESCGHGVYQILILSLKSISGLAILVIQFAKYMTNALSLSLQHLGLRFSRSYELIGVSMVYLFFIYYMWRYGL